MTTRADSSVISPPPSGGPNPHVVIFDFAAKTCEECGTPGIQAAVDGGKFVWIDIDLDAVPSAKDTISSLKLVPDTLIEDILAREPATQLARFPDFLHLVLTGCRLIGEELTLERVDVVIGHKFLLSTHRGPREFIDMVKRDYEIDFKRFAQSPSFLIYELLEDLTEHYVAVQKRIERRVDRLQADLMHSTDDTVFEHVSKIGSDLLHFRSVLTPARTVFTELATRRTVFVNEATQSFINNMVGTIERVLQDVMVDRDILAQSLNLHMSLISHRTNRAMNKLTVISTIFLPLTFLCGVYGMNFEVLPELRWRFGYALFWGASSVIVFALLWVMRRNRLL